MQEPLTLDEIDEALQHLRAIPLEERGAAWYAYCDSLLEERRQLAPRADAPQFSDTLR